MQLNGRTALITGAGSGLGRGIAERFAAEGARLLLTDISTDGLAETVEAIRAAGGQAKGETCDVGDADQCRTSVEHAVQALGRLDILVNNAGIGLQRRFLETTRADLERILRVNLIGAFDMAREAATVMSRQSPIDGFGAGRVINMASITGQRGMVGRAAYSASKGGIIALTRVMAVELAKHEISVNGIAPGPVETAIAKVMHTQATRDAFAQNIPKVRYATVEEVAAAALFLASDQAGYINGQILNVDGGFNAAGMIFEIED